MSAPPSGGHGTSSATSSDLTEHRAHCWPATGTHRPTNVCITPRGLDDGGSRSSNRPHSPRTGNRSGNQAVECYSRRPLLPCGRHGQDQERTLGDDAASRQRWRSAGRARHPLTPRPRCATRGPRSRRPTQPAGSDPPPPARPVRRPARGGGRPGPRDIPRAAVPPRDSTRDSPADCAGFSPDSIRPRSSPMAVTQ